MSKDKNKRKKIDLPDSTKDEVFIHQTLQNMGATEEEAIAFANIFRNMIEALGDRLVERVDSKMNWMIGLIAGFGGFITLFLAILTFFRNSVG